MLLLIFLFGAYLTSISSTDTAVVHDFYWRDYTAGDIPCDAFEAAPGLYIGQVKTKEHNIVANIYPSSGQAVTAYAGEVLIIEDDIKIFCSPDNSKFYWEYVDFDKPQAQQLQDAVRGGYHDNTRDPLFIGKVMHQEEWKIGKVNTYKHENNRGIWVWNQQQQPVNLHQFQILKYKTANEDVPDDVQEFYWKDYIPGHIPHDAFEGAPKKYVGQVLVRLDNYSHIAPATIDPETNLATAEFGGKQVIKEYFKILCSPDNSRFYWEYVDLDKPLEQARKNAVRGGFDGVIYIFIGKVLHEDGWKISKVVFDSEDGTGFHLWNQNGWSVRLKETHLLKYNTTKTSRKRCNT